MDSTDDEEDALEAMRHSDLGGASMNTHEEPENERFENGVRETIEFEEALGHLNLKQKIGDGIDTILGDSASQLISIHVSFSRVLNPN